MKNTTILTDFDLFLFGEGNHLKLYERLGAHPYTLDGQGGTHFAVWAPNANSVSVVGDFNNWNKNQNYLSPCGSSGIWSGFIGGVAAGAIYKYEIISNIGSYAVQKADPVGFYSEVPPRTASVVFDLEGYSWGDAEWCASRAQNRMHHEQQLLIYELHLGSWMRVPEEGNRSLTYRELAGRLVPYVKELGFTHVEFLPVMEHPFEGSWGYQPSGFFAPTSRFGNPHDFMYLIDTLHQNGIGVILDWVPAHFPTDNHGLSFFDGTHLYEHEDPRKGMHPDWGTLIFNYGRREVSNFLRANALFWLDKYHIDGLRVDAVASMIYLDYSREEGGWIPNSFGGRENLEAIEFLKQLNTEVYQGPPGTMTIAEESTAWPLVSRPIYLGGLGFGFKWNMGWMNDILYYITKDPIHRAFHHNNLTFGLLYAFQENFVLPFSHDEVVHGKRSMLAKMPGDDWQKFANLRSLYGYMYGHPGKKLLFMGCEFGQWNEWDHQKSLDWHLLEFPLHSGLRRWIKDLNCLLRREPALFEKDGEESGFRWIDCGDAAQSVVSFIRSGFGSSAPMLCVCNFTPVARDHYRLGIPMSGYWEEILNSDSEVYGGSGIGNLGGLSTEEVPSHGETQSLALRLPPLSALFFRPAA